MTLNVRQASANDSDAMSGAVLARAHLVIGLGEIGRATINRVRRDLARNPDRAKSVQFLSIDLEDAASTPYGAIPTLLRDRDADFLPLDMESVREYSDQLQGDIREWLSRYDTALDIGSDQAAHPRRLGALLLAAKTERLRSLLEERAHALEYAIGGEGIPSIHVVGYLAGGIGGGALTQLLEMLRRDPSIIGQGHVVVYGLLPALAGGDDTEEGQAAAVNAGAALKELSGVRHRASRRGTPAETRDLGFQRLCDETLVIAPPKATGRAAMDTQTLPEALAMVVGQRIQIGARTRPRNAADPFGSRSIVALAPMSMTTGAKEIEDALTLSIAQSAAFQMLYANWRHRRGFLPEAAPMRHAEYARRVDAQNRWRLSADHLIQSAPVLPRDRDDPNWRMMSEDWSLAIDGMIELTRSLPRRQWLDSLTRLCNLRFTEDFRGVGVAAFFKERRGIKRDIAREIRKSVEGDLFELWRSGDIGLADLAGILRELIALQRERLDKVEERVANIRLTEEMCRVRIVAANQEWPGLRRWDWFGKRSLTHLRAYGVCLHELYVNMTRAEGWLFTRSLLPAVLEELETLSDRMETIARVVQQGARDLDFVLDGLSARLEAERDGNPGFTVHVYDDGALRGLVQDILSDEPGQTDLAAEARRMLIDYSSTFDRRGFRPLAEWIERADWTQHLTDMARTQVAAAKGRWTAYAHEILDISIYDSLEREADHDFVQLRERIAGLIRDAVALLPDHAEDRFPIRLHVILPDDPNRAEFIKAVRAAFTFSRRGDVRFSSAEGRADSIQVLVSTDPFSLPDMELLRQMDTHYRECIERDREYAILSLHAVGVSEDAPTAGNDGKTTPNAQRIAALLLIGLPLGIVLEQGNGEGAGLWLVPKDADGFDETPISLAEDLLSAGSVISGPIASMLDDNIVRALEASGRDTAHLIEAVVERVARIRRRRGDNPVDPIYRAFVDAGKIAVALVREHAEGMSNHGD